MPKKGKGKKKGKKDKKPVRVETKYDDWELPRIEAQTAKYKDLLEKAAMDRNQVQMDKVYCQRFATKLCRACRSSLCSAGCCTAVL